MRRKFLSKKLNHPLFKTRYYEDMDESWCYINWYQGIVTGFIKNPGIGIWNGELLLLEYQKNNLRNVMGEIRGIRLFPGHPMMGDRKRWNSLSDKEKKFVKRIDVVLEEVERKLRSCEEGISKIQKEIEKTFEIKDIASLGIQFFDVERKFKELSEEWADKIKRITQRIQDKKIREVVKDELISWARQEFWNLKNKLRDDIETLCWKLGFSTKEYDEWLSSISETQFFDETYKLRDEIDKHFKEFTDEWFIKEIGNRLKNLGV